MQSEPKAALETKMGCDIPPTAKGPPFKVSSERLEKPRIELATPRLQGE